MVVKASVGFNSNEISNFRLKLEEFFLYIATEGKLDKTVILNKLEDIVLKKNIVKSGDKGFALRSEVSAPLHIDNELVEMLCIDGDENDIFSEQDNYILELLPSTRDPRKIKADTRMYEIKNKKKIDPHL